jgi:hypothetical protein
MSPLVSKIVEKIFVYDNQIIGSALHGNYNYTTVLNENNKAPAKIASALEVSVSIGIAKLVLS